MHTYVHAQVLNTLLLTFPAKLPWMNINIVNTETLVFKTQSNMSWQHLGKCVDQCHGIGACVAQQPLEGC